MRRLVKFPSESGEPILVEVEDVGLGGETRRSLSTSAVVERAQTSFEDALEKAKPMATGLVGKLRAIGDAAGNPPDSTCQAASTCRPTTLPPWSPRWSSGEPGRRSGYRVPLTAPASPRERAKR